MFAAVDRLQKAAEHNPCQEIQDATRVLASHSVAPYIRFMFPYEIQILDEENDLKSQNGESSHSNYRLRQLRAVRHRVFPSQLLVR